jgi:hypothetical protein
MAIISCTVTITTIGADADNFTVTDGLGNTYTNVSRADLLAGYTNTFDDTAANITVTSTGVCNNSLVIPFVAPTPTPTATPVPPTPTPSPTIEPTPTPTPTSTPKIGVSVKLSLDGFTICSENFVLRYTDDGTLSTGKLLMLANGSPVTGFSFVTDGGPIYNLDQVTGVIGADTGFPTC